MTYDSQPVTPASGAFAAGPAEAGDDALAREAAHFDSIWERVPLRRVTSVLQVPGVDNLRGKRILICSCGSGDQPVMAANTGAEVYAVDISPVGVANARKMAEHNQVKIEATVMDLNVLTYPDGFFDVIYGTAILHHIDCERAGAQFFRCLKPGGVAFFGGETSDANPILSFFYKLLGRWDTAGHPKKFLFIGRTGTRDERMLGKTDIEQLQRFFGANVRVQHERFIFFQKLSHVMGCRLLGLTAALDRVVDRVLPFLKRYSYDQDVWMQKPGP
jgi:SAM-dependent methyltransferase